MKALLVLLCGLFLVGPVFLSMLSEPIGWVLLAIFALAYLTKKQSH